MAHLTTLSALPNNHSTPINNDSKNHSSEAQNRLESKITENTSNGLPRPSNPLKQSSIINQRYSDHESRAFNLHKILFVLKKHLMFG